jgi:mRNA interferase MazF
MTTVALVDRGDVFDADLPGLGPRPVVVATRQAAIPVLSNVTVIPVTTTIRGHSAEVPLGPGHGLDTDSVANCDNVLTLPKARLTRRRGTLRAEDVARLDASLRFALGLD